MGLYFNRHIAKDISTPSFPCLFPKRMFLYQMTDWMDFLRLNANNRPMMKHDSQKHQNGMILISGIKTTPNAKKCLCHSNCSSSKPSRICGQRCPPDCPLNTGSKIYRLFADYIVMVQCAWYWPFNSRNASVIMSQPSSISAPIRRLQCRGLSRSCSATLLLVL